MKQLPLKNQNVVKFNIKPFLPIVFCVLMVYSSCRKADNSMAPKTSTKSIATDTIGGQIAVNIGKSLAGTFGGVNIMSSTDSVSVTGHKGPQKGYNANALCGFFTDSLVNYDSQVGDTTYHTGGELKFYFNCKDGKSTGYTAYDSLNTIRTTPKQVYQYYVKQSYTIQCLDDKHLFNGVNGENRFASTTITHCSCHDTYTDVGGADYLLKDLKIDVCKQDIISGTATFTAFGTGWSVSGSIVFLGNHMADITINGKLYHVNLLSGKVA